MYGSPGTFILTHVTPKQDYLWQLQVNITEMLLAACKEVLKGYFSYDA